MIVTGKEIAELWKINLYENDAPTINTTYPRLVPNDDTKDEIVLIQSN